MAPDPTEYDAVVEIKAEEFKVDADAIAKELDLAVESAEAEASEAEGS